MSAESRSNDANALYWKRVLAGELPHATIEPDSSRARRGTTTYDRIELDLDQALSASVASLAASAACSVFSVLSTAAVLFLSKYVRGDEVVIGTPALAEQDVETYPSRVLPLRVSFHREKTCRDLLDHVETVARQAFEHQAISSEQLLSALGLEPSQDRFPLFDVAVSMAGYTQSFDTERHPVDVAFEFRVETTHIHCVVNYRSALYEARKVTRAASHFEAALRELVSHEDSAIQNVELLSEEEKRELVFALNDNTVAFPLEKTFHGLFEERVEESPSRTAVVFAEERLDYRTLNRSANRLAHALVKAGIRKGDFVAILQHRNCNFLVAMLAVFKAGGAYVPVDPAYPPDRIQYMLADCQARFLVTQAEGSLDLSKMIEQAPELELIVSQKGGIDPSAFQEHSDVVLLGPSELAKFSGENPGLDLSGRDRAYMIYTSGSTGLPKGAICRHDGALNHLYGELHGLGIRDAFSFLQTAASSSDISVWQFLAPVLTGGTTYIVDHDTVVDPELLFQVMQENRLELVELVPVVLRALLDHIASLPGERRALPALRCMMATGDALPVDLVNSWFDLYPSIPVANTYGPTEASDDVTLYVTHERLPSHRTIVPIGRPMPNLSLFILDPSLRLAPFGIPGEICVSGVGVGEGYWNKPEKTKSAFIVNPVAGAPGETVYRTGDLGRWLPDGTIEFLGRIDQQVKIRGFRIEPGEVESALLAHDDVSEVVVMARADGAGNKSLVAYVVPESGRSLDVSELRGFLVSAVPDYMVPAAFVTLDELPLTPIGKIDRKALQALEVVDSRPVTSTRGPRTESERAIAEIWAKVLGLPSLGVDDDFLSLGGDSILSINVATLAREAGFPIRPKHLFQFPTVAELAAEADAWKEAGIADGRAAREVDAEASTVGDQERSLSTEETAFALSGLDANHLQHLRERYPRLEDVYPLSPTQHALYLNWLLSPRSSGAYVEQIAFTLHGSVDPDVLEEAFRSVIRETPTLRTAFTRKRLPGPRQVILEDESFELLSLDWRERDTHAAELRAELRRLANDERSRGFDLSRPPLMRTVLVRLDDATYRMLWSYHHIILDGWSEPLVLERVFRAYAALRGRGAPPAHARASYRDFVEWLEGQDWQEAESYWRRQLEGFTEPHRLLPVTATQPTKASGITHAWVEHDLVDERARAVEAAARSWKVTLSTVLQGTWALVLSQVFETRDRDIVFGSAVSGRQAEVEHIERIPGLFIETLPLRVRLEENASVRSWMAKLQAHTVEMRQFEHFGPERMAATSEVPRERLPLFDTIFVMANYPGSDLARGLGDELAVTDVEYMTMPHYPITVFVVAGETISLRLVYAREVLDEHTASVLLDRYVDMLAEVVSNAETTLGNALSEDRWPSLSPLRAP